MKKKRREILNALMEEFKLEREKGFNDAEALDHMKKYFSQNDDYKNENLYEEYGNLYVQIVEEFLTVAHFFVEK